MPYNRFPIGAYLAFKAALLPFGPDLAAQIRAAQRVTLLFFAGAAVLAYRALRVPLRVPQMFRLSILCGLDDWPRVRAIKA